MRRPTEGTPLLDINDVDVAELELGIHNDIQVRDDGQISLGRRSQILSTLKILSAPLSGAGSVYSTFGPIAIYYQPGLWLLAPVSTGAVISISDAVFAHLKKKNPRSPLLNKLSKLAQRTNGVGIGYLANVGFHWSIIKNTAVFIGGIRYESNQFAKLIAPILSLLPAALTTNLRYRQGNGQLVERSYARHIASFLRGATSISTVFGILTLQGVLEPNSYIPMVANMSVGLLALTASVVQESSPQIARSIMTLIRLLGENVSLAALSFALLNDIYAATHDNDVPDDFFYTNMGINSLYYVILTVMTVGLLIRPNIVHAERERDEVEPADVLFEEAQEDAATEESRPDQPDEPRERAHSFGGFGFHDRSANEAETVEKPEDKAENSTPKGRGRSSSFSK